ncbi:hypothetical protein CNR37_00024 [Pseudomonas phage ventosus]|uniref:Uncharacterized protein n=1 Tax=Pseudomonas phage ventosus TaxID=2048980 RepID=A0A2H4P7S0_9CAUD|nr:hypothetical protein CNR37_00024 [Pseudomonas phage ventosus]
MVHDRNTMPDVDASLVLILTTPTDVRDMHLNSDQLGINVQASERHIPDAKFES